MSQIYDTSLAINGRTDIGAVRNENEDNIRWYCHPTLPYGYVVIADGMGGYTGGAMASSIAVDAIGQTLELLLNTTFLACTPDQQTLMIDASIIEGIDKANQYILNAKESHHHLEKMGTTVVISLVWKQNITIAHIGDSRAYVWSTEGLRQLTEDHNILQEMINAGSLTEKQARASSLRNQITQAVGISKNIEPTINKFPLSESSILMLCSDGLTEYLDNNELEHILSNHRPALECVYRLIDEANHLGGKDNISVGIIECSLIQSTPNSILGQQKSTEQDEHITIKTHER